MIESQIISRLIALKPQNRKLYLVGGAVRDILLQKPGKDFDLVCDFDTRKIARAFADAQHGGFYVLDPERNTSRVILTTGNTRIFYDFARLQGADIAQDLKLRDFTINAMAIDLEEPGHIIDPLGGAADLKDRVLRACSDHSFSDDPVRVIRGVRYAVSLSLTMTPATLRALKEAVSLIHTISLERNRDEFLKVLDTGKPEIGLQLLERLGILEHLEIASGPGLAQAAQSCRALELLFSELEGIGSKEVRQGLQLSAFLLRLGRFKDLILKHIHTPNSSGRTWRTLDLLAAVLNQFPRDVFEKSVEKLALSNEEKARFAAIYDNRNLLSTWTGIPDGRQIYRFFKKAPVDSCLLWLADLMSRPIAESSQKAWLDALAICERLIESWAEHSNVLAPKPLLNGNDLKLQFDLPPGKRMGQLLEELLEEQAAGTVTTREQALEWVENHIPPQMLQ